MGKSFIKNVYVIGIIVGFGLGFCFAMLLITLILITL